MDGTYAASTHAPEGIYQSQTWEDWLSSQMAPLRQLRVHLTDYEHIIEPDVWLQVIYISAALFFVLSLRGLSHQESAKMGNVYGVIGMLVAIVGTLVSPFVYGRAIWIFFVVCVPPAVLSVIVAMLVNMTSIPQLVGALNAFGGLAATLESFALYFSPYEVAKQDAMHSGGETRYVQFQVYQTVFYLIGASVGMITFTGSMVACGKLSGWIASKPRVLPLRWLWMPLLLGLLLAAGAGAGVFGLNDVPVGAVCLGLCTLLSALYGVCFVSAIGGADMPVVISVLNSGSGWAGVFAGLTLQNSIIIIAGAFVGASGIILSYVMCRAMNRSLYNVLVGGFGDTGAETNAQLFEGEANIVQSEQVCEELLASKSVIIVPGYGMAVSHAQFAVQELIAQLRERGTRVRLAIHPVAGRLPGHMNVLLAEADVPYDIVFSMEEINDEFPDTDTVIIIGANDTVNPAAQDAPGCPIYGMPVLEVWKAARVVVLKRSMRVGYAGIDNPLFFYPNCQMLLGDAKASVQSLVAGLHSSVARASPSTALPMPAESPKPKGAGAAAAAKGEQDDGSAADERPVSLLLTDRTGVSDEANKGTPAKPGSASAVEEAQTAEAAPPAFFVGVLRERQALERRVAMTPNVVCMMRDNLQLGCIVETNAGLSAGFLDEQYRAAGAIVVGSPAEVVRRSRVVLKVTSYSPDELNLAQPPVEAKDAEAKDTEEKANALPGDSESPVPTASLPPLKPREGGAETEGDASAPKAPSFLSSSEKVFVAGFIGPHAATRKSPPSAAAGSGAADAAPPREGGASSPVDALIAAALRLPHVTLLSLDVLPRLTVTQKMDVLSSTAKLAGYRAVVEAISHFGRLMGPEITAAGKYPPAKVLVVGAGVAGLQAIGDAHRLGADVRGFDVRLECKEQVESMGGKYLVMDFSEEGAGDGQNASQGASGYAQPMSEAFLRKEMALFAEQCAEIDILITTAALPGRPAPKLIKREHVDLMKPGSVIVDLAAPSGGNVERTRPGETYLYSEKVTVVGWTDLPSRMAPQASEMFARNLFNLLQHMGGGARFSVNFGDQVIRAITVTRNGEQTFPPPALKKDDPPLARTASGASSRHLTSAHAAGEEEARKPAAPRSWSERLQMRLQTRWRGIVAPLDILTVIAIAAFTALFAATAPPSFPPLLFVFLLACFVGYLLVWNVAPALHTPLMSVTNAISGAVLVGGMLGIGARAYEVLDRDAVCPRGQLGPLEPFYCRSRGAAATVLNAVAIAVASMNVFGGFAVTQRMLNMFRKSAAN
ncbi:putative NAD(P) transhydrogenase subunit beta [Besnoitia besnoiti]|uniref:proton-translocating NAD(P)(+) transhydrogenase n=1 Tax=Besnoitia besnoiti TaxID=94643 RepID=A0A2A9M9G6_BESBE|nr:putative NAD(P) transhydrogenase subunit beta [Besnoitia besnoiti]PFH32257.1 putative NAD(P) transhydrogenase subunit beta [Besnoitia besnoiti]